MNLIHTSQSISVVHCQSKKFNKICSIYKSKQKLTIIKIILTNVGPPNPKQSSPIYKNKFAPASENNK